MDAALQPSGCTSERKGNQVERPRVVDEARAPDKGIHSDAGTGAARVQIAPGVFIAPGELQLQAMTGGGPGGQHVNRSATRVTVRWNVRESRSISDDQRARIIRALASRIDSDGWLRITAGEFRSQHQNRRAAMERLSGLVARALVVPKARKATKPTRASIERRLDAKRRRSDRKRLRSTRPDSD